MTTHRGTLYNGNSTYRKGCYCVCVRLFDGLALAFHRKSESYGLDPNVVLATSIISKTEFHPKIDKTERKWLCKTLDCRKQSVEASKNSTQYQLLPLRMMV